MTDTFKGTPGPWVRDNNDGYSINRIFAGARGHYAIAQVIGDDAETEANGDLIAAAPDLLAALEGLSEAYAALCRMTGKNFCEAESSRYEVARTAIAKARGENK
jgi:hypothetical protein